MNLTDDGKDYTHIYDAFNRLCTVKTRGGSPATVAEYTYNGLGYRTGEHSDVTRSGGGAPDGTVDSSDPWYYFSYDERWRRVRTFRGSDSSPKETFTNHFAGLDGMGGSSYIDLVAWRDRDASTNWYDAADASDERRYYCQNWRADVSAVITDTGKMVEWVKYSAYGVPFAIPAGDTESDGDYDATDEANQGGGYEARKDADLDGVVDASDVVQAKSTTSGYQTLGRGVLSSTAVSNRKGYAGYDASAMGSSHHHARHRDFSLALGTWLRRDPMGYADGINLLTYVDGDPVSKSDPLGLQGCRSGCGNQGEVIAGPFWWIPYLPLSTDWLHGASYNARRVLSLLCRQEFWKLRHMVPRSFPLAECADTSLRC